MHDDHDLERSARDRAAGDPPLIITDGNGHVEEIRGDGVVGEQPVLAPGQFEYLSRCPLRTPFGTMKGTYQMVTRDGDRFDARIAEFTLSEPYTVHYPAQEAPRSSFKRSIEKKRVLEHRDTGAAESQSRRMFPDAA